MSARHGCAYNGLCQSAHAFLCALTSVCIHHSCPLSLTCTCVQVPSWTANAKFHLIAVLSQMGKAHLHNREKPSYYLFESHTETHSFQLPVVVLTHNCFLKLFLKLLWPAATTLVTDMSRVAQRPKHSVVAQSFSC